MQIAPALTWLALIGLLDSVHSADWPQLLGPAANGISTETGLSSRWPKSGPPLLFNHPIGTGYSAPALRGNRLVVHHRIDNQEIVELRTPETGTVVWRHATPTRFRDPYGYNNGPRSTPLLTEDRCYTFGAEGRLICLDLQTGQLVWECDTPARWTIPEAFFGVGSSPTIAGDTLLLMVGGQPNAGMVGFDPRTGEVLWENVGEKIWQGQPMLGWPGEPRVQWRSWHKQASYSTPVLARFAKQTVALCLMRQGLVALDPQSGRERFHFWFRAKVNESVNAANPVVVDNQILLSAAYYRIGSILLRVGDEAESCQETWRSPVLECHWATPIHHQGYLYAFSGRNEPDASLRCVEFATGKLQWQRDESWTPRSNSQPNVFGRGTLLLSLIHI